MPSANPPDWYIAMRVAERLRIPFTEAEPVPLPIAKTWALIAMAAEAEAEKVLMDRRS